MSAYVPLTLPSVTLSTRPAQIHKFVCLCAPDFVSEPYMQEYMRLHSDKCGAALCRPLVTYGEGNTNMLSNASDGDDRCGRQCRFPRVPGPRMHCLSVVPPGSSGIHKERSYHTMVTLSLHSSPVDLCRLTKSSLLPTVFLFSSILRVV